MPKRLFKLVCVILMLAVALSNVSGVAFAQTGNITTNTLEPISYQTETYLSDGIDFNPKDYDTDLAVFVEDLREAMTERAPSIMLRFTSETEYDSDSLKQFILDLFELAFSETDKPDQGDYLRYAYNGFSTGQGSSYIGDGRNFYYTIPLNIHYYTTKAQEDAVENRIEEIIENFGFTSETTAKVKSDAIYKYITQNVEYDYANLENEDYKLKYTAYAALINGTAVCQGYASLYYRMAKKCGLDARVISGVSYNQRHAWNIVKADGLHYYYLDSTWDADESEYHYYLKGSEDFLNHISDDIFKTDEFEKNYPISPTDYAGHNYEKLDEDSFDIRYICKVCGDIKEISKLPSGETLAKGSDGKWYYFIDGEKSNAQTLVKYKGKWLYVNNGVWDNKANLLVKYGGNWLYVKNGVWTKDTTLVKHNGKYLYVKNGVWAKDTTLIKYSGNWLYVKKGIWTKNTTLIKYGSNWLYVKNGVWTKDTTLTKYGGNWLYIKKGVWTKDTTLVKYNGKYLYVKKGVWTKDTKIVKYGKNKYYIKKGVSQPEYSGTVKIDGKKYNIKKGKVA